jgi:hypothetical protein
MRDASGQTQMTAKSQEGRPMAFKLDFTKLNRPRSAEEIEATWQAERAEARKEDARKREEYSKKTVVMTISEVEARHTMTGGREILVWGKQPDGRDIRAKLFFADCYDREVADPIFADLYENRGTRTMHGYWKSYQNSDKKVSWTFNAQKIDGITIPA